MPVDKEPAANPDTNPDEPDRERREALRSIARFGVYVAPAMTVLISPADAFHPSRGHCAKEPWIKGCSTL